MTIKAYESIDMFNDIIDMHEKFKIDSDVWASGPRLLIGDERTFRISAMKEELIEFIEAETPIDQIDALVDLVVFAMGAAEQMGAKWNPHWREVMEKNMQKELVKNAGESKRGHKLDLKKPEGWTPPDHQKVI